MLSMHDVPLELDDADVDDDEAKAVEAIELDAATDVDPVVDVELPDVVVAAFVVDDAAA